MVQSNIVTNKLFFINFSLGHVSWWRPFFYHFTPALFKKNQIVENHVMTIPKCINSEDIVNISQAKHVFDSGR